MHAGEALERLKRIRDEYEAARYAVGRQLLLMRADLAALQAAEVAGISVTELNRCAGRLEVTYVVRLFATFEAILLNYWQHGMGRRTSALQRNIGIDLIDLSRPKYCLLHGLDLVDAVSHQLSDNGGRGVAAQRAHAGIAVRVGANSEVKFSRTGKHDAEIGREHCVRRGFQSIVGFDRTGAHAEHEVALA